MVSCPVCDSSRVVIVLSPARRAFCLRCESRWIQEGSLQRAVQRADGIDGRGRRVIRLTDRPGRPAQGSGELPSASTVPTA